MNEEISSIRNPSSQIRRTFYLNFACYTVLADNLSLRYDFFLKKDFCVIKTVFAV